VQTIAATTTRSGLTVEAVLDTNTHPTGVKVSAAEQKAIPLQKYAFHGEWNYTIHPGPISESLRNKTITFEPTK
jgi:Rhodopirellula transposase DDE domain